MHGGSLGRATGAVLVCPVGVRVHSVGLATFKWELLPEHEAFIFNSAKLPCSTLHSFRTRPSTHSLRRSAHARCTTIVFAPGPSQACTPHKRALSSSPYGTSKEGSCPEHSSSSLNTITGTDGAEIDIPGLCVKIY